MSNQLAKSYHHIKNFSGNYVLATIIETMGSTYQKAGARMLIAESGEFTGLLGGGCFESDLNEHAAAVLASGKPKVVFYDMRSPEDAIWGLGLGCNGAVRVLLQAVTKNNQHTPFDLVQEGIENEQSGVLITYCESDHDQFKAGESVFLNSSTNNTLQKKPACDEIFYQSAQDVLEKDTPLLAEHIIDGKKVTVFYDLLKPPFKLLIIGAGPDAVSVTTFAKLLGWQITVVDHREEFIKSERFPSVDYLINLTPSALNEKLQLDQFDALILMTHSIDYDERYLKMITNCNIPYIGLLGPAKRRDRLLETLKEESINIQDRVYGPTGLDIGARSPEEIALSVIAEIQAVTSKRDGGLLSQKNAPINS